MATPALAPNRKVAGYVLLEKLGSGGIGEVWKARDPRLNRIVALKFLHAARPGSAPERDLLAEARAVSALNHPNIVTIFQVSEAEEGCYLAMEFVEGETLRARLRGGTIAPAEAIDIASQVAGALTAAHDHGIIHRDLKPENIMLRVDGYVKLVDFGLAKLLPWAQSAQSGMLSAPTQTGELVGTFQYMSPEQARGQTITPASDIFSLGIVLHEMLTGEHPFEAPSVMDTLTAILQKDPPAVSARCPAAPPQLVSAVQRALKKNPQERFASAREMLEHIRASQRQLKSESGDSEKRPLRMGLLAGGAAAVVLAVALVVAFVVPRNGHGIAPAAAQVQSLAILNLHASGDDPALAGIAETLADDLGTALSRGGIQVASRSTTTAAGTTDVRTIGGQLGVDAVLDGSIRPFANKYKVHLELVSTRNGFQLWSDNFVVNAEDFAAGDDKAAITMAEELRLAMGARR